MENRVEGLHHLAISTTDIKKQIEFFTDKLGMELIALYWMHGAKETWHGFLRMNDESSVAFVQSPKIASIPASMGATHAGNPTAPSAGGTTQHIALKVKDMDVLAVMQQRLRSKGVPVLGPVDHGFCQSIYFAGPEGLALELSCSEKPIEPEKWIDPDVVGRAGISADELVRYRNPPRFVPPVHPVDQPGPDAPGPHMTNYPPGIYEKLIALSDKEVWDASESAPPVKDEL
ncbi:VOC family protein [Parasphingorhabdus sp.]|uniref:VOC family protein n=1 Tax=Parasphingorhabdus sp. TaxID=2709688 RepID=UPI003A94BE86